MTCLVATLTLDVRINNGDHLAALVSQISLHVSWVREIDLTNKSYVALLFKDALVAVAYLIPSEVLFAISVLNIEPHDIIRDVMNIKVCIHVTHILLALVVPSAL